MEQNLTNDPAAPNPEKDQQWEVLRQALLQDKDKDPTFWETAGAVASDIGGGLAEAPGQIVRGAQEAVNEVSDTTFSIGKWLNDNIMDLGHLKFGGDAKGGSGPEGWVQWHPGMPGENSAKFGEGAMPDQPGTVTGGFINDVSQFMTGFAMAGRYLKALGVPTATSVGGAVAQGMVKGAITDATAFDPHEERLSNLVQKYPNLQNPITEFLAASEDDSEAMGRFKNALEGLATGAIVDSLLHGVRAIKLRRAGKQAEAEEALAEADKTLGLDEEGRYPGTEEAKGAATAPDVDFVVKPKGEEEQLDLGLEGGGPRPDSPRETFGDANGDMKPGDAAADIPGRRPSKGEEFQPAKKIVEPDEPKLREWVSARIAEFGFGQGRNFSGIRTDLIETDGDLAQTMSAMRRVYREETAKAMGGNSDGVRSWENTRRNAEAFADIIGEDPRLFTQRMAAIHKETTHLDAELLVYRDMLATINDKLEKVAEIVANPQGSTGHYKTREEAMQDFAKQFELMANVQLYYKGIQTHIARSMNAMKIVAGKNRNGILPADPSSLWQGGPRNVEKLARTIVANKGNLKGNAKVTRGGFARKAMDVTNEFYINSILSGLKTHVVNMTSGIVNTAFLPMEKMVAGAFKGDLDAIKEAGHHYAGVALSLREATQLAYKALKAGDPVLDPTHGGTEHRAAISAQNLGISDPVMSAIVNGLGNIVRVPGRLLTAEDEFLKQLNYRAQVRSQAWREAHAQGLDKDPKRFAEFVHDRMEAAFDARGAATNEKALGYARDVTYTNDLAVPNGGWFSDKTIGEGLQSFAAQHPGLRLIMPFIRTPTNIMRFVHNRTPMINLARKQYYMDFMGKNGPDRAADARAQFLTGSVLWASAATFVMDGTITGGGPADRDIKKALMDTGWRPYSVRVQNEDGSVRYVAYNRFDPFGMFFGLAADAAEVLNAHPERDAEDVALAMTTALAKNLNSKSYLTGIVNALGALSEPERKLEYFAQGLVGGFIPNTLQQQFNSDPLMREARSLVDALRRKTPGFSEDLDPQRNVLGEKQYAPPYLGPDWLSPVATGIHKGGHQPVTDEWKATPQKEVYDELARLMFINNSAIKPPPADIDGVDLTKYQSPISGFTAHDRYQELTGTIEIGGLNLKQQLEKLFSSDLYKNRLTDGNYDVNGSRIDQVRNVVGAYRQAAQQVLGREIPELYWDLIEAKRKNALMKVQQPAQ